MSTLDNREKSEILKVASRLFRDNTLIGVVRTGDGKDEKGFCFVIVNRNNGVSIGVGVKGLQIFRFTQPQIMAMRQNGDLANPFELGESLIIDPPSIIKGANGHDR